MCAFPLPLRGRFGRERFPRVPLYPPAADTALPVATVLGPAGAEEPKAGHRFNRDHNPWPAGLNNCRK